MLDFRWPTIRCEIDGGFRLERFCAGLVSEPQPGSPARGSGGRGMRPHLPREGVRLERSAALIIAIRSLRMTLTFRDWPRFQQERLRSAALYCVGACSAGTMPSLPVCGLPPTSINTSLAVPETTCAASAPRWLLREQRSSVILLPSLRDALLVFVHSNRRLVISLC